MVAADRHRAKVIALRSAILETPGDASSDARAAAERGASTGTAADTYLAKVRRDSVRITDGDIDELRRSGLSEDAILELTLAAAFGEAARRFERAVLAVASRPDRSD